MYRVSVVLPNYNHAKFLRQRIDSVLNQSFQDFELIILDDCSSDNSKEIIELYREHPKVSSIIYNNENSGSTFKQWEKGIKAAQGKYVWFAESDDYADPQFLEKMVPLLEDNEHVGLAFCNSHVIDGAGYITSNTNTWIGAYEIKQEADKTTTFNGFQFCLKYLFYTCRIPNASAALFRREPVINNIHWIDTSLRNSGDWKLWINICLTSDIVWLNQDLNFFRIHGSNVTNSIELLNKEAHLILKDLIKRNHSQKIYESLVIWSFKSAPWVNGFTINVANIKRYFENNRSLKSGFYLITYLNKQFIISMKKRMSSY
ncbi:glycosyl transferase family 2 [Pontibacter ummariensis]|uniref:Glycosyl transferase family 2 n=1 Tax=Pontibacter ummariensis TaxID=1610492 RepID=A0A239BL70_9BACT|nr:glycosyltransferase [Pontibacter ummariensis]PRY15755.1 glycosyl transferase family 2 [Pontibacter ummariensis]SNS08895.1 Glycosyl transferase family 2 [Pontibacter ummariensis]